MPRSSKVVGGEDQNSGWVPGGASRWISIFPEARRSGQIRAMFFTSFRRISTFRCYAGGNPRIGGPMNAHVPEVDFPHVTEFGHDSLVEISVTGGGLTLWGAGDTADELCQKVQIRLDPQSP